MKRLLLLLTSAVMLVLVSCETDSKYRYIHGDNQPVEIVAKTDSIAYVVAYEKFCNSLKSQRISKLTLEDYKNPARRFFLINPRGEDITYLVTFPGKELAEREIEKRVFAGVTPFDLNSIMENLEVFWHLSRVNYAKAEQLLPGFVVYRDEFDPQKPVSYRPKSAPLHTGVNWIYCYFYVRKGMPVSIRFRAQYYDDTWVFFTKAQFSIDGNAFDLTPSYTNRRLESDGKVWEWFDVELRERDKELIFALANAQAAKIRFIGRNYSRTHTIPQKQIDDIRETMELYYALGGTY